MKYELKVDRDLIANVIAEFAQSANASAVLRAIAEGFFLRAHVTENLKDRTEYVQYRRLADAAYAMARDEEKWEEENYGS